MNAAVHAIPFDGDCHRRRSGSSATPGYRERIGGCRHGLLFRVDITVIRGLVDARQRHGIQLGGGTTKALRSHGGNTHPADEQQAFAIGSPLSAGRVLKLVGGDHVFRAVLQIHDPDMGAQQVVLLAVRDPFTIGRELRTGNIGDIA